MEWQTIAAGPLNHKMPLPPMIKQPARQRRMADVAMMIWLIVGLALVALPGCGSKSSVPEEVAPPPQRPLRTMNSAIRRNQWQQAWEVSDAVLAEHGDDAEVLATVAQVAHASGKPEAAADLLVRACRAESFENESRVQQAMIAMIAVGRLYEGMAMLEEAIEQQPQQHETRRWLYDFYMGTENRLSGLPHGRFLVRQRKFDLDLLLDLSNTQQRTADSRPLDEMTARNPDDKRPLLGGAKTDFDMGKYDQCIETLNSILEAHPDYLPAEALLGRVLAATSQFDAVQQWAGQQQEPIKQFIGYWLAIGDLYRSQGQTEAAARAYWEATRRDIDVMEPWSKLSTAMQQLSANDASIAPQMLESIGRRAAQLSAFNRSRHRFTRTGRISRAVAVEVVAALKDLGRLWEAEAWASIAMSLPEDDAVDVEGARNSIVAMLEQETPWQLTEGYPELHLDLTNLALPAIGSGSSSNADSAIAGQQVGKEFTGLKLLNEATSRGLVFFGRTADDLDQTGIMLYETLGCGGGTIDYDLDGWPDLYLAAARGTPPNDDSDANAMMRNMGGLFTDVTKESNSGDTRFGQGIAVGDLNEDGFPDLLVLNYGPNTLLINNGDGTFSDRSERLAENGNHWSASAAIADVDGDGLNDMTIVNYCTGMEPTTENCPNEVTGIIYSCSPMAFAGHPDSFLRSTGDGAFQDWQVTTNDIGRGLGIVAGSFDDEPGLDVYVANDMTNNHFWSGDRGAADAGLVESAMPRGLGIDDRALPQGSMGIATADFDRDGDIDFYVTNFNGEYNTYYDNRGSGSWRDETIKLGLSESTLQLVGFGSEAIDLENDGNLELVLANGHVDVFPRSDQYTGVEVETLYEQPMQIFRRNESGVFDSIGPSIVGEYLSRPHVGRALWTLDANRDGLTDMALTHQTEPVALLINRSQTSGNWIAFELRGRSCARDAIGATIEVTAGDQSWTAPLVSGDGYLCSNERVLRFGLGDIEAPCDVTVSWPDGTSDHHRGLAIQANWLIIQSDALPYQLR